MWKLLQAGKSPDVLAEAKLRDVVRFACTSAGLSTAKPSGISSVPEYAEVLSNIN